MRAAGKKKCILTEDAKGSNQGREGADLRDGGSNDVRNGPIHWDTDGEVVFTPSHSQLGSTKNLHQNVVVDDFDTNVAIQCSSNETRGQRNGVRRSL